MAEVASSAPLLGSLLGASLPLAVVLLLFGAGAAAVWLAGTRLSRYADALAERRSWGRAFVGVLLLGGITSLPELTTTVTAALVGNPVLAVNNILGGVAMQVTILAAADVAVGRGAITALGGASEELLEGTLLVGVLATVAAGIVVGGGTLGPVGLWTALAFALVVGGLFAIKRYEAAPRWQPVGLAGIEAEPVDPAPPALADPDAPTPAERAAVLEPRHALYAWPTQRLVVATVGVAAVILVAGTLVALTGDALAAQTGLGAGFVGAVFVAVATSLPEVSVTLEAVRLRQHRMAFANVFGTNLFDVGLLLVADLATPTSVLDAVGASALFGTLLGIGLTVVYLAGIIERQDRTVLRMGWDSLAVLVLYVGGLVILYRLQ